MRAILLGRKSVAANTLRYMIDCGIKVVTVVAPPKTQLALSKDRLADAAESCGIPVATDTHLYNILSGKVRDPEIDLSNIDLVLSVLFQKRIKGPLISLPTIGGINFHPAPLPEFRGWGTYSFGILENVQSWAATAHLIEEQFDTGPIIKIRGFEVMMEKETAFTLEQRTQPVMLELIKDVILDVLTSKQIVGHPQSEGQYFSKRDFYNARKITPSDSAEIVCRKARAFWYPPYSGAQLDIGNLQLTVVTPEVMRQVGSMYHGQEFSEGAEESLVE